MSHGYIHIYQPEHPFTSNRNYILEHRFVMEKHLGRYMKPEESCHHLNEIKTDNRPKNFMGFTSESAHQRFHKDPSNVKPEEIIFDGRKLLNKK